MTWHENPARYGGRHRRGEPVTQVRPRRWDTVNRQRAEELDLAEDEWAIWYGVGTRCFHAVAHWPTSDLLTVQAPTAEELEALMREAEQTAPPRTSPPPDDRPPQLPHPPADRPPPPPSPSDRSGRAFSPVVSTPPLPGGAVPETPNGLRAACWDPPYDPSAIGEVRRAVRETLTAWALAYLADDVVLVVGELLANAVTYGEPPVRLSLWAGAGELSVRVTDHGPDQPRHLDLGVEAVHGRGLTIVDALADDSGTAPLPDGPGKAAWARWRLTAVAGRPDATGREDHRTPDHTPGRAPDHALGLAPEPTPDRASRSNLDR
ncbi:ATP-binding protein [Streptosporangium carneum]|uniref:Histidine kinase/HSP90-like ATPase domain-containing protein n=1 Tax=Streptosporangium carneum TaxID=47481 RepID=A0A9W6I6P9_9ACTN|nr:ATP-binding protein [Streptosporangium carneum]GLK13080.1 hypothetical protein GCM10017600_64910 [Streptosporangium carneum]